MHCVTWALPACSFPWPGVMLMLAVAALHLHTVESSLVRSACESQDVPSGQSSCWWAMHGLLAIMPLETAFEPAPDDVWA